VNYKELTILHDKYHSQGLEILAFPCNQFGKQEPGSAEEIRAFVDKYGAQYQFFEKIKVNGENAHPLYKWLKPRAPGILGNQIKWNFSKFLVTTEGMPIKRYAPNVNPLKLCGAIEAELAKVEDNQSTKLAKLDI